MKLFASIYLDQDVPVELADILRNRGFDALTTRDANNLGSEDDEQLAFAVSQQRLVVTHNRRHFERLAKEYFEQERTHHGIVIAVRRRDASQIARRLIALLDNLTADELVNQTLYI